MTDRDTENRIIELRARGNSYFSISSEIQERECLDRLTATS